jgi:hypothetical protein
VGLWQNCGKIRMKSSSYRQPLIWSFSNFIMYVCMCVFLYRLLRVHYYLEAVPTTAAGGSEFIRLDAVSNCEWICPRSLRSGLGGNQTRDLWGHDSNTCVTTPHRLWRRVNSPLPCCLIFSPTAHHGRVGYGFRWSRNSKPNLSPCRDLNPNML